MKVSFLVILVTFSVILLFNDVAGDDEKPLKHKKHRKHRKTKVAPSTILPIGENNGIEVKEESYFESKQAPAEYLSRSELEEKIAEGKELENLSLHKTKSEDKIVKQQINEEVKSEEKPLTDLCGLKKCGAGRICELNESGVPTCICIHECPRENEPRRKICNNFNETWDSDCEAYRKRCICEEFPQQCERPEYAHVHIEYYGECRLMPECTENEMADFPRRMRDWLFNIMKDMADREELSPHFMKLQREGETNMTKRWTNAAVWKFCDLDGHPADRSVSRHELFPIRAPLMSLEHCIAPFLNKCDADDNHLISLKEWAKCLELEEDDIEDQCEDLRGAAQEEVEDE